MKHWIEPEVLGAAQRSGINSPTLPGMTAHGIQHYVNRPGQLQGVGDETQHYVNRPGQLSGFFDTVKASLPTLFVGAVIGVVAWPWLQKQIKRN